MRVGVAAYEDNAFKHAVTAMQVLADRDSPTAMFNLGVILRERGGEQDLIDAEAWYRKAAQAGYSRAMNNLRVLLEQRGGEQDLIDAEAWYREAAQAGDRDAMYNLGAILNSVAVSRT